MTAPAIVGTPAPMALRCPKCAAPMTTYERSGVVLDQCTECRGVFLDRGELERIVDAEGRHPFAAPASAPRPARPAPRQPAYHADERYRPMERAGDDEWRPVRVEGRGYRSEWGHDDRDDDRDDRDDDRGRHGRWDDGRGRPAKRRSLLGELLEGFGD